MILKARLCIYLTKNAVTTIQSLTSKARRDPQSGPRAPVGGFYHCSLAWVRGTDGAIPSLRLANYIDREIQTQDHDRDVDELLGRDLSHYIDRKGTFLSAEPEELGAAILISRGLPVENGQQFARLLDAKERKADRTYRRYGGKLPRVASHLIVSFTYGITSDKAGEILENFATALSNRLAIPLYGRIHNKNGRPDHIHLLIGTRSVKDGKLGPKVRALDAVSEKIAGEGIHVGDGKLVGATCDWIRGEWARLQREASFDEHIDHRSYARRGLDIAPVTHVPRSEIEWEKRHSSTAWRDRRRRELDSRQHPDRPTSIHHEHVTEAEPDLAGKDEKRKTQRVDAHKEVEARARKLVNKFIKPTLAEVGADDDTTAAIMHSTFGIDIPIQVFATALRRRIVAVQTTGRDVDAAQSALATEAEEGHSLHEQPVFPSCPETAVAQEASVAEIPPARHPGEVAAAIALHHRLQHTHRRGTAYTERLAEWAGMDVAAFEAASKQDMEDNPNRPLITSSPEVLPLELWALWEQWRAEENAKRRDRRAINRGASDPTPAPRENSPQAPSSHPIDPLRDRLSAALDAEHHASIPTEGALDSAIHASDTGSNGGPHHGLQAPSLASGLLEQALVKAFVSEVQARYRKRNREPPHGQDLGRDLAVLLRATGRGTDEVTTVLTEGSVATGTMGSTLWVKDCVAHAFSAETTRKLAARPSFVTRAQWIEGATETKLYRRLRRGALDELKADLNQVWVTRQLQADDAHRRHAARLSMLHEIRWRTRRLHRRGLVPLMLSLLVEHTILQPLIKRQNAIATAERQAINARAAKLNTELKTLRNDWRSMTPEQAQMVFNRQSASDEATKTAMGDLLARVLQKATPPRTVVYPLTVEERRGVVVDVAMVMIARGSWTEDVGDRLARLIPSDRAALWSAAHHKCQSAFGHGTPHRLAEPDIHLLWARAVTTAKSRDWVVMVEHMRDLSIRRRNRDQERGRA